MLYCKKLNINAILPTVTHAGEDLGYDLYASEDIFLEKNIVTKVSTGIAARFIEQYFDNLGSFSSFSSSQKYGLLIKDRSSMAARGITVSAGVIDAGYAGELLELLTNHNNDTYYIKTGDKIAQIIPTVVKTSAAVTEVNELPLSARSDKGFGSSGR